MSITIHPQLESKLRDRAEAQGLSVEAYVERLLLAEQKAEDEIQSLALEGLDSGDPIEGGSAFWEERRRRLEERLKT
jgi:hypothetical protein